MYIFVPKVTLRDMSRYEGRTCWLCICLIANMYLGPCTQHRLVVGAELLSSMQHNESEVSDCELIAALPSNKPCRFFPYHYSFTAIDAMYKSGFGRRDLSVRPSVRLLMSSCCSCFGMLTLSTHKGRGQWVHTVEAPGRWRPTSAGRWSPTSAKDVVLMGPCWTVTLLLLTYVVLACWPCRLVVYEMWRGQCHYKTCES